MSKLRIAITGLLILGIAGVLFPAFSAPVKKSEKKTVTKLPRLDPSYEHDGKELPFTSQPRITPDYHCILGNPNDESVHVIRFMEKGVIRIYQGNENLDKATPQQAACQNMDNVRRSVVPGTSTPITVVAKYTWGYDDKGMLTIYSDNTSGRQPVFKYDKVRTSTQDPDKISYSGRYMLKTGLWRASLSAVKVTFGD